MGKNGTFFFLFFPLLFKEKRNLLLHGYTFFMGNNIVVVQRDTTTTHKKILSWASHILRTYRLFYYVVYYFINFIYAVRALLNSFHIMVQTLKSVRFTNPFRNPKKFPRNHPDPLSTAQSITSLSEC